MNKLLKKLQSKGGESLIEALVSVLIFTFASIMLYSMVTSSSNINTKAKSMDSAHQQQMLVAEQGEGAGVTGRVEITLEGIGIPIPVGSAEVSIYGGVGEGNVPDGSLYAYYVKAGG